MTDSLPGKICDFLIKNKLVTEEDLNKSREICKEQGGSLGDVLVKMNALSREDLLTAMSEGLGFAPLDLSRFNIDEGVIKLIPQKICQRHQVLPVSRIGNILTVAMVDPMNISALDDIKAITKMEVVQVVVDQDNMREAISKYFERSANEEISEIMGDIRTSQMEMVTESDEDVSSSELLRSAEEAPVVKLTNLILSRAVKDGASDILIEPMDKTARVRYRIDGVLRENMEPPKKLHRAIVSRLKVMSNLNIAERRLPQDGRFKIRTENRRVDFRVSVIPSSMGEKVALRILDKAQATLDVDKLGFSEDGKKKLIRASSKPHGMILVCGPTGCGKTTTLYSIMNYIDSPELNLVTVEDPVEYELKGVNQVSVKEDMGLTFAACLRSILRQDPDIILVGEIRDLETVDTAIKSALTGHLVLSTLHTNTASGSIVRLVNMGVEPFLISSSVELVAAQALLRRLCPDCKEAYTPAKEIADRYKLFDESGGIAKIYKPKGCKNCGDTGYQGREGIIECLELTPTIKELIFRRAEELEIERTAKKEGMSTLRQNGIAKVLKGITSLEEVLRVTMEDRG